MLRSLSCREGSGVKNTEMRRRVKCKFINLHHHVFPRQPSPCVYICKSSAYRAAECNMVQCSSSSPLTDYHLTLPPKEQRSDFKSVSRWRATTLAVQQFLSFFFFLSSAFASAFISAGRKKKINKIKSPKSSGLLAWRFSRAGSRLFSAPTC